MCIISPWVFTTRHWPTYFNFDIFQRRSKGRGGGRHEVSKGEVFILSIISSEDKYLPILNNFLF
jgi:hypothetical protein